MSERTVQCPMCDERGRVDSKTLDAWLDFDAVAIEQRTAEAIASWLEHVDDNKVKFPYEIADAIRSGAWKAKP